MAEVHMNHKRIRATGENTAGRLFQIFFECEKFKQAKSTVSASDMWKQAFDLEKASRDALSYLILDVSAEIDQLVSEAIEFGLPVDMYEALCERMKRTASVTTLEQPASAVTSNLATADALSLRWMSLVLPDVCQSDLAPQARDRMVKAIGELRTAAAAPGVSPAYGQYARQLANRLEKALLEARVKGSAAVAQAAFESIAQSITVPPNEGGAEVVAANKQVVFASLETIKTMGESTSNGEKIVNFVNKARAKDGPSLSYDAEMFGSGLM